MMRMVSVSDEQIEIKALLEKTNEAVNELKRCVRKSDGYSAVWAINNLWNSDEYNTIIKRLENKGHRR